VELLEAGTGTEAVAIARARRPPLVLLDVGLPEMDGWEVCQELKADPATRGARIVMLTARATAADRERAAEAGADGYLTKPFSPAELLAAVTTWLPA
jgi:CheY-like chemotaxis protein